MKKWKLISVLGVLALLLSCVQEREAVQPASLQPAEGQKMTINFSVAGPELQASTKVLNNGGDIQALYLAVFGSSGYLKEYVKADLTGESTKTYTVEKQVETASGVPTVIEVDHTVPVYNFTARVTITDSPRRIHFLGNGPGSLPFGYDTAIMPLQMSQLSDSGVGEKAYWQILDLPNGLRRIGSQAFWDCSGLSRLDIPVGVESLDDHAFTDCKGITDVVIPDTVTFIGYEVFMGCSSLVRLTIPEQYVKEARMDFGIKVTVTPYSR